MKTVITGIFFKSLSIVFLAAVFLGLIKFIFAHHLNMLELIGAMTAYIALHVAVLYFTFIKKGR